MLDDTLANEIRCGAFTVHPETGELRKNGERVPLHPKPFQFLLVLLAQPGKVVTREELRDQLWPGQPFLEFDNGLNNAASRLRHALGDTQAPYRYIETIPRHGYRLRVAASQPAAHPVAGRPRGRSWLAAAGAAAALGLFLWGPPPATRVAVPSLAVLPFCGSGSDLPSRGMALAVTEAVRADLVNLIRLNVAPEGSVILLQKAGSPLARIERELGVGTVVEGAVAREPGARLRVTLRMLRVGSGLPFWAHSYDSSAADLPALQIAAARGLARAVSRGFPPAIPVSSQPPSR